MISIETATDIAITYREIETAEKLVADVRETVQKRGEIKADLRDVFGRSRDGLELGIPSGDNSRRLFNVPYGLAVPVIEAHIAACRAKLVILNEKAATEIAA